jgi:membrane protein implicated in regulation of membrane protease activity
MGLVYLFALVVALGMLAVQIVAGARGAGHHGDLAPAGHDHDAAAADEFGFWTVVLSLRFWTFFALGFGLSGSLIHLFALAPALATLLIAAFAGACSGTFAVMAFRMVRRTSTITEARASQAVGRIGRVVVPCAPGVLGQVRVELGGGSVDLLAASEEDDIAKGEAVLVEDVRDNVARISRRPSELH